MWGNKFGTVGAMRNSSQRCAVAGGDLAERISALRAYPMHMVLMGRLTAGRSAVKSSSLYGTR